MPHVAFWPSLTVCFLSPALSLRGLFVIDDKGILRQITINDLPVGRSVDETLRLVQAFQHTDKYGEGKRLAGFTCFCLLLQEPAQGSTVGPLYLHML